MGDIYIISALIAFLVLWLWAFLDIIFSTFKKTRWKITWLLVITFFPVLGSILYLVLKKDFKAQRRTFQPHFRQDSTH